MNMKKKKILLVIFILIITYILISFICKSEVFAINQTTTTDINSIDSNQYPQIKEILQNLKREHPNWKFKILYTDIEWNSAIANEYVGHGGSPRNLVPANNSNYEGEWICKACGKDKLYDSGKWHCASEAAIAYMLDPRNSTNNSDIFQFMELTYNGCNMETIKTMVSNTFLNNESCINAIVSAAQKYNVNVYYIIARILQEQGTNGTVLATGSGWNGLYVGFYNVFNIGATGNNKETVILNGLKRAYSQWWTSLESSIDGGVAIIASSYIARGQNTIYFQKFDVENSDGALYWHQYMQNILAAQSEGATLRRTFSNIGSIDGEYTFIIPLYKNMPATAFPRPSTSNVEAPTVTELVKVNVAKSLRLRNAPNGTSTVGWIYKDEVVTRLTKGVEKVSGTYWDYVMKSDGTKGYAARETYDYESSYKLYLVPIEQPNNPVKPEEPIEPTIPDKPADSDHEILKNDKVKFDKTDNKVIAVPNATVKDIVELMGENIVIKNSKGEVVSADSKLATGMTINDTQVISILGDINGDGEINSGDLFYTQKYLLKQMELDECYKEACDVNNDNEINSGDLFFIQKYLLKKTEFSI